MEAIASIDKQKIQRYFQSITVLPHCHQPMSIKEIDKMIMEESDDIYSLFQLMVFVRHQQMLLKNQFGMFRRLLSLIFCIANTYQLYHSKIKTLALFWWESCLKYKKFLCAKNSSSKTIDSDVQVYKGKIMKDQFYFHALRCFISIIGNFKDTKYLINPLEQSQSTQILSSIQLIVQLIKQNLAQNGREIEYKTSLAIEYSKFLIIVLQYRRSKHNDGDLFLQFFQSIMIIIRLMKKFFIPSQNKYQESLTILIKNGYEVFKNTIPNNKCKVLITILSFLQRKEKYNDETKKEIKFSKISDSEKLSIRLVSRIINGWKSVEHNKMMRRLTLDIYVPNVAYKEIQNLNTFANKNKLTEKGKQRLTIINKKKNISTTLLNCPITQLKKKRSQSLKIQRQSFVSNMEIQYEVRNQAQKHFSTAKLLTRHRSFSAKSSINSQKFKRDADIQKQIELKMQNEKCHEEKRKENHRILTLVSRKAGRGFLPNKQN